MAELRKHSQASNIFRVLMRNSSTGAPLTGLSSASSGLIISTIADVESTATAYTGANLESITTLGTYAAPTSGKVRFKEVDATNHPGLYEIQLADARFSVSNAKKLVVSWSGATSLLTDHYDVALNGPVDATHIGGTAQTGRDVGASVLLSSGTGTGQVSLSSGAVTVGTNNDKTGYALSSAGVQAVWDALTSGLSTAGSIGKRIVDYLTGDVYARVGAPAGASIAADVAALKTVADAVNTKTANLPSDPADASDVAAAIAALNNLSSAQAQTACASALTAYAAATLSETPASSGSAPTRDQALQMLFAYWLQNFAYSGTTRTTKKADGSTTEFTHSIDSATAPTAQTRLG